MKLTVFGISHNTASIDILEKFSFNSTLKQKIIDLFLNPAALWQDQSARLEPACQKMYGLVLSTCNRTEIYLSLPHNVEDYLFLKKIIKKTLNIDAMDFYKNFYKYTDIEAARHLFRVASGIDSMVIGETQILSQIKDAYYYFKSAGTTDSLLNKLFEAAFRTGKKVRAETNISRYPVSISSIAVRLAEDTFKNLKNKKVLVIGAGKMSELSCMYLHKRDAKIVVCSRTLENAEKLAKRFHGTSVSFDRFDDILLDVDIIITQTSAPHPIITFDRINIIMKKRHYRELFIIDIAVPRNVDKTCKKIKNLYYYDIDDLQTTADKNNALRKKEIVKC
ncbi:MAG: glutamyl-tRNA reductase, partial [Candidatus Hydrogenedentota bacterium]